MNQRRALEFLLFAALLPLFNGSVWAALWNAAVLGWRPADAVWFVLAGVFLVHYLVVRAACGRFSLKGLAGLCAAWAFFGMLADVSLRQVFRSYRPKTPEVFSKEWLEQAAILLCVYVACYALFTLLVWLLRRWAIARRGRMIVSGRRREG